MKSLASFTTGLLAAAVAMSTANATGTSPASAAAGEAAVVDGLLAKMTLAEKLGQLNQPPGLDNNTGPAALAGGEDQIRRGEIGSFLGSTGAALSCRLQKIAVDESRLGVPLLFATDVIHGFRTVFPVPLGEAASFNPAEVERSARISAIEATAHGVHWTFAPMLDVSREPRWGRIVEGSGEDPYLTGVLAAAAVHGYQGKDLAAPDTLLATAKHFVAYGAVEAGRDYNTVDTSPRTLHEIYLPPFKAAVDAGVGSIMAAFNEVEGTPMHANGGLINGLLRQQWGWDGLLVSDYTGVMELMPHGVAANPTEAGVRGLNAGVDVDMVSRIYVNNVPEAVKDGRVSMATIDAAVRRILQVKYRLGLFEDPYRYCKDPQREAANTLTPEFRAAARELARQSLVLLDNRDDTLPYSKDIKTLAVIGPLADSQRDMLGNWAVHGRAEDAVTPLAALRAALPGTRIVSVPGSDIEGMDRSGFQAAVDAARQADAVLLFIGEHQDMSAEARNRTSLDLPGVQLELATAVAAVGKPTAAVVFNGRPLALGALRKQVPAILEAWYPGVEAGNALVDVLFGDVSPSGKLPVTFPRNVGQVPIYYNHKNTGRPPREEERYTSKYIDVPWTPEYPFGHGLSYTQFEYSGLQVGSATIAPDGTQQVRVTVTNTGKRAGTEVVQLYVRDEVGTFTRPVKMLRDFERVTLAPGKSRTLAFTLDQEDLAMLDAQLQPVVEPGWFTVYVGGSSEDTVQARFEVR